MPQAESFPLYEAFAVPDKRRHALEGKLPKLVMGPEYVKYFGTLEETIGEKPARKVHLRLTEQIASVGVTPLSIGDLSPGIWRISTHVRVTRPGTVSSSIQVTVHWTDGGDAQTESGAALNGNAVTTREGKTFIIRNDAAAPISVSTTYATAGATDMQYALDVVAEQLAMDDLGD